MVRKIAIITSIVILLSLSAAFIGAFLYHLIGDYARKEIELSLLITYGVFAGVFMMLFISICICGSCYIFELCKGDTRDPTWYSVYESI